MPSPMATVSSRPYGRVRFKSRIRYAARNRRADLRRPADDCEEGRSGSPPQKCPNEGEKQADVTDAIGLEERAKAR
jgi:hypothetical protein